MSTLKSVTKFKEIIEIIFGITLCLDTLLELQENKIFLFIFNDSNDHFFKHYLLLLCYCCNGGDIKEY